MQCTVYTSCTLHYVHNIKFQVMQFGNKALESVKDPKAWIDLLDEEGKIKDLFCIKNSVSFKSLA